MGSLGSKKSGGPSQLARGHFSVRGSRLRASFFSICSFHQGRLSTLRAPSAGKCSFAFSYNISAVGRTSAMAVSRKLLWPPRTYTTARCLAGGEWRDPPIAHIPASGSRRRNPTASLRAPQATRGDAPLFSDDRHEQHAWAAKGTIRSGRSDQNEPPTR